MSIGFHALSESVHDGTVPEGTGLAGVCDAVEGSDAEQWTAVELGAAVIEGRSDEMGAGLVEVTLPVPSDAALAVVEGVLPALTDMPLPALDAKTQAAQEMGGIFDSSLIGLAKRRGELRMQPEMIEETEVTYLTSPQLQACRAELITFRHRYGAAFDKLLHAMGTPRLALVADSRTCPEQSWQEYGSWHLTEYTDGASGATTPVAYEVVVRVKDDLPREITVRQHVVQRPQHDYAPDMRRFEGLMTGLVCYEDDVQTAQYGWEALCVDPDDKILQALADRLIDDADKEAVRAAVESYQALPPPTGEVYEFALNHFGRQDFIDISHIVTGKSEDVASLLVRVFTAEQAQERLRAFIGQPLVETGNDLKEYGLTERYNWLLQNAGAIRRAIVSGRQHTISFDLLSALTERLGEEEVKIARLEALAARLAPMENISDRAPHSGGRRP